MIRKYLTPVTAFLSARARVATLASAMVAWSIAPATAPAQQTPTSRADRVQWLQQHAAPIRTIDPGDEDFSDLAALGTAIGASRILMLGEQSHGDGTTFLAKTRIIKYLHEKRGFDVLAFESGFYDVPKAWTSLRGGEDASKAVARGVFGIWTGSAEFKPLVAYVGKQALSPHPLELTGFDDQFTGTASTDFFRTDLITFLGAHEIDTASMREWPLVTRILDGLLSRSWKKQMPTKNQISDYYASWAALRYRVDRIAVRDSTVEFWRQMLKSTEALTKHVLYDKSDSNHVTDNIRDTQMAENLLWLARVRFPGRKIIVWAATYHIIRNADLIGYDDTATMGHFVSATLQRGVYSIGFIASEGSAGLWTEVPKPIHVPPIGSLDAMFASTTHQNAFIDFRRLPRGGEWLREPFSSSPLGYGADAGRWTQVLDGMIYTRRMTPSTPTRGAPGTASYSDGERQLAACLRGSQLGCGLAIGQFALIPAGTFQMGSSRGDSTVKPVHRVTISHPFYMQKTEVTQAQWREVMGSNPSWFSTCGDTCPVENMNWDDIQTFLQRLNAGRADVAYRLPSEAEWEYAARAGSIGDVYGPLDSVAWYGLNATSKIHPVAGKQANAWGLYDMIGNVWELVNDWYSADYYAASPPTDPLGPDSGKDRLVRGGSWSTTATFSSVGVRVHNPSFRGRGVGLRLVMTP